MASQKAKKGPLQSKASSQVRAVMIRRYIFPSIQKRSCYTLSKEWTPYLKSTEVKIASLQLWKEVLVDQEKDPSEKAKVSALYETAIEEAKKADSECRLLDGLAKEIISELDKN